MARKEPRGRPVARSCGALPKGSLATGRPLGYGSGLRERTLKRTGAGDLARTQGRQEAGSWLPVWVDERPFFEAEQNPATSFRRPRGCLAAGPPLGTSLAVLGVGAVLEVACQLGAINFAEPEADALSGDSVVPAIGARENRAFGGSFRLDEELKSGGRRLRPKGGGLAGARQGTRQFPAASGSVRIREGKCGGRHDGEGSRWALGSRDRGHRWRTRQRRR